MNEVTMQSPQQTPTTVFSGFLGSGKTTIISNLIETLQKNNITVAYIKNEIGDTDIDAQLLKGKNIETKELLNGCICCTLVGPFESAVTELIDRYHPNKIIIEASGAADPSAIALMIGTHPRLYRDGIISVIDVENFEGYKDLSTTAQRQTQFTDLIIFNKVEMVSLEQKKAVVGYVRELNTHSPIVEAPEGKVNPDLIFGIDPAHLDASIAGSTGHDLKNHIHDDHFSAFTIKNTQKYSEAALQAILESLPKSLFRTKGVFQNESDNWVSFNGVGKKITFMLVDNQTQFTENIFVFIGLHADDFKAETEAKLL
ncbi:MAG: GTP-binding protein [Candidatus Pacebacteria bacterium]|nr:GTP-binding protein [Candidatus Paceibacterota bacterium]PIR64013.1 MAG: hypothetical protein COU64_01165 [Candidatus Pacebacteria bacterium CG10_big_fil_rev_8_21_14_0_10_40_26]PIZ79634.1 MAG: hypothetical protein COY01_00740 [Candidatus Pacebacteria bacterium CG_4_10_14_0_2_um_filter_40_20]PJA69087.1 MAG: hypothetical protein CO156_01990 [Candidatus Pacebacteria bacterium CG_4_9_14_3_um_filter_40_12]PJC41779.1 MAG: hypothetical protein CO041_03615 [Candidatus Pacebacteria bacterium CG_4_9_1